MVDMRIVLEGDFEKYWNKVKEYYNLKSNTELVRLMTIRFYHYVKEQKKNGKDKMNL